LKLSKNVIVAICLVGLAAAGVAIATRMQSSAEGSASAALTAPATARTLATAPVAAIYVAVDGTPAGDGSQAHPRDLQSALSQQSPANPGDTIYLKAGTYPGNFTSELRGAELAPIIVRAVPGERVTLSAATATAPALTVNGIWTWFADFEITNPKPERITAEVQNVPFRHGVGVQIGTASNVKLINLVVHDLEGGIIIPAETEGVEVYGNIIYYNGWQRADGVGEGHGILTPNMTSARYIRDNIVFDQFSHGIQAYGSEVDNLYIEGNVLFNNGGIAKFLDRNVLVGGGSRNLVFSNNMTYYTAGPAAMGEGVNIGFGGDCPAARINDNYLTGSNPLQLTKCRPEEMHGNTLHGRFDPQDVKRYADNHFMAPKPPPTPTMSGVQVFVRPNAYEPGRATITIFNWDRLPTASVDVSKVLSRSGQFVLHNAANYFGPPVLSGTYEGGALTVPMRSLSNALPVGTVTTPPPVTAPEFAVFVIEKSPHGATSTTR
jgi:hypothetical protein